MKITKQDLALAKRIKSEGVAGAKVAFGVTNGQRVFHVSDGGTTTARTIKANDWPSCPLNAEFLKASRGDEQKHEVDITDWTQEVKPLLDAIANREVI